MEEKYATLFKALSDENRIRILNLLAEKERSASELLAELDIVQSTLSHHMSLLCESGLVKSENDGKWVFYSVNRDGFGEAENVLHEFIRTAYYAQSRSESSEREGWNKLVSYID